jgi:hypothetical protein
MLKFRILLPALLLGLCLPVMAQQVYRSTDAQGNIVFSDKPTQGSETVTIDAPNIADSVKVPAPQPEQAPEVANEEAAPAPKSESTNIQKEVDDETNYLRNRRYFYSNGDPRPRNR